MVQSYSHLEDIHKQLLSEGYIYHFGRDKMNRPVVVMDLVKINLGLKKGLGDQII